MNPKDWIKSVLLSVDPDIREWYQATDVPEYTVWRTTVYDTNDADDTTDEDVLTVYVDRFTRDPDDAFPAALKKALAREYIPYTHNATREDDTGYIHHIFKLTVTTGKDIDEDE